MDAKTIIVLAADARDAYVDRGDDESEWRKSIRKMVERREGSDLKFYQESGNDAFSYIFGDQIRIIFRGTQGGFDIITDIRTAKVKSELAGKVHAGFMKGTTILVVRGLMETIIEAKEAGLKILMAGHSLGAAQAQCLASICVARKIPVDYVLACCSPRVGDKLFAAFLEDRMSGKLVRTQNNRDPVPRIPIWSAGFRHAGNCLYFDRMEEAHINPHWLFVVYDQWMDFFHDLRRFKFPKSIKDHSSETNADLVRKHVNKISVEVQDLSFE